MNKINQIVIWDWCERLFWAMAGIMVFLFALAFTYDEPQFETEAAPKIEPCLPVNNSIPTELTFLESCRLLEFCDAISSAAL